MGSYVPSTPAERQSMLRAVGFSDYRELYRDVPESMYLDHPQIGRASCRERV